MLTFNFVFAAEEGELPGGRLPHEVIETTTTKKGGLTSDFSAEILDQDFFVTDIGSFIGTAINAIIIVAFLLCLGYMLWGGIDWLTSEGDKEKYWTLFLRDRENFRKRFGV